MNMKIIKNEKRLCPSCMKEHEVKTVITKEQTTFKGIKVIYEAVSFYCDDSKELYADEQQIRENDIRIKDAYRSAMSLLTSSEISDIRTKYGISQKDLSTLLGWGAKTITRYESHQVQDRAHDMILRKIDQDPEWFLMLLDDAKENLSSSAYKKYLLKGTDLYRKSLDIYLRKAVKAIALNR